MCIFKEPVSSSCAMGHLQLLFLISQKFSNGLTIDSLGFLAQESSRILIFFLNSVI